jgi:glutathione S-transferase
MITLHTFGRAFGLPDPSPFVVKTEILMKMSGVEYKLSPGADVRKGPKQKVPYITDKGKKIGDSTFIRYHLEQEYGVVFPSACSPQESSTLFLAEKHCEDNLYFLIASSRWMIDGNFDKEPRHFFDAAPALLRGFIAKQVRGTVKKMLWLQGMGRHSVDEQKLLASKSAEALSTLLGDKTFFAGDTPCVYDAGIFAFINSMICPHFACPFAPVFRSQENLVRYCDRMLAAFYPDLASS